PKSLSRRCSHSGDESACPTAAGKPPTAADAAGIATTLTVPTRKSANARIIACVSSIEHLLAFLAHEQDRRVAAMDRVVLVPAAPLLQRRRIRHFAERCAVLQQL